MVGRRLGLLIRLIAAFSSSLSSSPCNPFAARDGLGLALGRLDFGLKTGGALGVGLLLALALTLVKECRHALVKVVFGPRHGEAAQFQLLQ